LKKGNLRSFKISPEQTRPSLKTKLLHLPHLVLDQLLLTHLLKLIKVIIAKEEKQHKNRVTR